MNFSYKHSEENKVVIKGTLSSDGTKVLVEEKDGDREITIQDYLSKFVDDYVEITIKNKSDNDLEC